METLSVGACGGLLMALTGLPASYMSGAMLAVAGVSLAGRQLYLPPILGSINSAIIGMTIGSSISPSMMHGLATYSTSLLVLMISTVLVVTTSMLYLRIVHRWDTLAALLAAAPGALSQMVVLAVDTKSDAVGVAIAQIVRVMLLVLLVPLGLALMGYSVGSGIQSQTAMAPPSSLALIVTGSVLAGYGLFRIHSPASWMFGAMFAAGALHGFGVVEGGLPRFMPILALIGLGTMIGTRFAGLTPAGVLRYLAAGVGTFVVAIVTIALFVLFDIWLAGARPQDVAMAFSPGGMDVMIAISLTMHLDPIFVAGHHLVRALGVSLVMPFLVRAVAPKVSELPETEI